MNLINTKGVTLTELIVSTILITIVLGGVTTFSLSLKQFQDARGESLHLTTRAGLVMQDVTEDLDLAVGDLSDPGVLYEADPTEPLQIICRRRDNTDSTSYADDLWTCYSTILGSQTLARCRGVPEGVLRYFWPNFTTNPTQMGGFFGGIGANPTNCPVAFGTYEEMDITLTDDNFYTVKLDDDTGTKIEYIEISIRTEADPTAPFHPIKNPTYELNNRISPSGLSQ